MDAHTPVMVDEVLSYLNPQPGDTYVDATYGGGGHAALILDRIQPAGTLVAIDRDPAAIARARELPGVHALLGNFADMFSLVRADVPRADIRGILIDCGISSTQLRDETLGISFAIDAPLDMRLDRTGTMTAAMILNTWSEHELVTLLRETGEESAAARIGKAIVEARSRTPFVHTTGLVHVIESVVRRRGKIHPATKTFQALRIAVNDELGSLQRGIAGALSLLGTGGRLAVLTFHSLEDRIVKRMFRQAHGNGWTVLTKHVVPPTRSEVMTNPRSRSAKLRVIERAAL